MLSEHFINLFILLSGTVADTSNHVISVFRMDRNIIFRKFGKNNLENPKEKSIVIEV